VAHSYGTPKSRFLENGYLRIQQKSHDNIMIVLYMGLYFIATSIIVEGLGVEGIIVTTHKKN
jgi:hypothetical protein